MADFLSNLADYLADQGLGSTTGSNATIFVGKQPADPDDCITLIGLAGGDVPNAHIREFIYPRFQVLIRNADYEAGGTAYLAVRSALHARLALTLADFHVLRCHAVQEGGPLGEDDRGRAEFALNFAAQARET